MKNVKKMSKKNHKMEEDDTIMNIMIRDFLRTPKKDRSSYIVFIRLFERLNIPIKKVIEVLIARKKFSILDKISKERKDLQNLVKKSITHFYERKEIKNIWKTNEEDFKTIFYRNKENGFEDRKNLEKNIKNKILNETPEDLEKLYFEIFKKKDHEALRYVIYYLYINPVNIDYLENVREYFEFSVLYIIDRQSYEIVKDHVKISDLNKAEVYASIGYIEKFMENKPQNHLISHFLLKAVRNNQYEFVKHVMDETNCEPCFLLYCTAIRKADSKLIDYLGNKWKESCQDDVKEYEEDIQHCYHRRYINLGDEENFAKLKDCVNTVELYRFFKQEVSEFPDENTEKQKRILLLLKDWIIEEYF